MGALAGKSARFPVLRRPPPGASLAPGALSTGRELCDPAGVDCQLSTLAGGVRSEWARLRVTKPGSQVSSWGAATFGGGTKVHGEACLLVAGAQVGEATARAVLRLVTSRRFCVLPARLRGGPRVGSGVLDTNSTQRTDACHPWLEAGWLSFGHAISSARHAAGKHWKTPQYSEPI